MKIEVIADLKLTLRHEKKKLTAALRAAGIEVVGAAKAILSGGSTDSVGGPPSSISGNLARHIKSTVVTKDNEIMAVVSDDAQALSDGLPYAVFLEAGTKHPAQSTGKQRSSANSAGASQRSHKAKLLESAAGGSAGFTAPRPFISLAYEQKKASIDERIKQAVLDDTKFVREK